VHEVEYLSIASIAEAAFGPRLIPITNPVSWNMRGVKHTLMGGYIDGQVSMPVETYHGGVLIGWGSYMFRGVAWRLKTRRKTADAVCKVP
jgi:hypothetical protein